VTNPRKKPLEAIPAHFIFWCAVWKDQNGLDSRITDVILDVSNKHFAWNRSQLGGFESSG